MSSNGSKTAAGRSRPSQPPVWGSCPDLPVPGHTTDGSQPVKKEVAVATCRLAIPHCYRCMANQSGVGKSAVGALVMEFCKAVNNVIYLWMVDICNMLEIIAGFERIAFPNCAGACHKERMNVSTAKDIT